MSRGSSIRSFLIGALIALAGAILWFWQSRVIAITPEANWTMTEWLNSSCFAGERNQVEGELRRFQRQLETPFINLFDQGPAAAEIAQVEANARREFEQVRALIQSGQKYGLPSDQLQALQLVSETDFVNRARRDFIDRRKSAALAALLVMGGSKGRRLLQQVAADPKSFYRDLAGPGLGDVQPN